MSLPLTVLIPAHNEGAYIAACLDALCASRDVVLRVIVVANGCRDDTAERARAKAADFAAQGHALTVIERAEGGKIGAWTTGEAAAGPGARAYLDADVHCDPDLMAQIATALDTPAPRYATGTLAVMPAQTAVTRAYARLWQELPFVKAGAVGAGCFALNAAGRARWEDFPPIISDDTFVRLNFAPAERIEVPARYHWPMVEGFGALVRVRRRQDAGVAEVRALYPQLAANDSTPPLGKAGALRLALRRPLDFAVYLAVHLAVRMRRADDSWTRGR